MHHSCTGGKGACEATNALRGTEGRVTEVEIVRAGTVVVAGAVVVWGIAWV